MSSGKQEMGSDQPRPSVALKGAIGLLACLLVGACGQPAKADPGRQFVCVDTRTGESFTYHYGHATLELSNGVRTITDDDGWVRQYTRDAFSRFKCRALPDGASSASTTDANRAPGTNPKPPSPKAP